VFVRFFCFVLLFKALLKVPHTRVIVFFMFGLQGSWTWPSPGAYVVAVTLTHSYLVQWLRLIISNGSHSVDASHPFTSRQKHFPKRCVLYILKFRIPGDRHKSINPVLLSVVHHRQNNLESAHSSVFFWSIILFQCMLFFLSYLRRPDPNSLLPNGYRGLFPTGKAVGAWSWPLTSN
jgi:hypothetical protein